ncbi:hypothetical protein DRQ50_07995 [bacterium]|nr:MAG: hypothetical protein DRQ50_07995 [bacterium]
MRIQNIQPGTTLRAVMVMIVIMVGIAMLMPRPARAQLVVRIQKQPVRIVTAPRARLAVTVGNRHQVCARPRSCRGNHVHKVAVTRGRYLKSKRTVTVQRCGNENVYRDIHRVWVPGQWVMTGPRTSRWVAGHWVRV